MDRATAIARQQNKIAHARRMVRNMERRGDVELLAMARENLAADEALLERLKSAAGPVNPLDLVTRRA